MVKIQPSQPAPDEAAVSIVRTLEPCASEGDPAGQLAGLVGDTQIRRRHMLVLWRQFVRPVEEGVEVLIVSLWLCFIGRDAPIVD